MQILGNTLALLLVLSVVVVVHEFGHFSVAKAFRFPVEVFSFGFGKRLFGKRWRGTDYRVSALPLGGYVKVVGLGPDESTLVDGTTRSLPPTGKRWQRGLILAAGPGMNFLLALSLHSAVFAIGVRVPAYELERPVVKIVEERSAGAQAGIRPGDRIVSIGGRETPRWRDVQFLFGINAREKLEVEVDRDGLGVFLQVVPEPRPPYDFGYVGLSPDFGATLRPRIKGIVDSPARDAGLKKGDVILEVAGRQVRGTLEDTTTKFVEAVAAAAPGPFSLRYLRDGKPGTSYVRPRKYPDGSWKIGVHVVPDLPEVIERFPIEQALVEGWRRVETDFRLTAAVIGRIFRGKASVRSMSGPLDIAKFSGEAARTGALPLVALMAAISLQLAILNLLPIPVLDGGHLFLLGLEGAVRRDFSLRVKERILQLGFLMILALMTVILYNDLAKNLPENWWPF